MKIENQLLGFLQNTKEAIDKLRNCASTFYTIRGINTKIPIKDMSISDLIIEINKVKAILGKG